MISVSDKSRLQVGLKQVLRALGENKAEKVFLASDCDGSICRQIQSLCEQNGVQLIEAATMRELGTMCNIEVKASCAAVLR